MNSALEFWNKKHQNYAARNFVLEPNLFALDIVSLIKPGTKLLDLGCGHGQDSLYFARRGISVSACDFSEFALTQFRDKAALAHVEQRVLDLSCLPYPFAGSSFDTVYSHLSLHYFDLATTERAFAEVGRILSPGGHFYAYFNSVRDPESQEGRELEPQYRELSPGDRKRFFSIEEFPALLGDRFLGVEASYGRGTTKDPKDEYVRLAAIRRED